MALLKLKAIRFGMIAGVNSMIHTDPNNSDEAVQFPIVTSEEDRERLIRQGLVDPKYVKNMATRTVEMPDANDGTRTMGDAAAEKTKELSGAEDRDQGATGLSTAGSVAFQGGPLPTGTQGSAGLPGGEGDGTGIGAFDPDAAPASGTSTPTPTAKPAAHKPASNGKPGPKSAGNR